MRSVFAVRPAAVIAATVTLMACSGSTTGTGGAVDGGDGGNGPGVGPERASGAEKACLDTVEALARAGERCKEDYRTTYNSVLEEAAGGDCKKVASIRDEPALRATCLPFLKAASCEQFAAGMVDPSCAQQLQRPASLRPVLGPASFFADER